MFSLVVRLSRKIGLKHREVTRNDQVVLRICPRINRHAVKANIGLVSGQLPADCERPNWLRSGRGEDPHAANDLVQLPGERQRPRINRQVPASRAASS